MQRICEYIKLMRLDKPIGMFLLLWPTLIGLWAAQRGQPDRFFLLIFMLGVITMRSAGCVINDLLDRKFDIHVSRTKHRPLAKKTITAFEAIIIFLLLITLAILLVWQLNIFTRYLAAFGLLITMIYPLMKRYFNYPQLILSLAFSWPILMAYSALNTALNFNIILLFLAIACWVTAFDTIYALVDRADDLKIGIKSTAITLGKNDTWFIKLCYYSCLVLLSIFGLIQQYKIYFFLSLILDLCLVNYQQTLLKSKSITNYFKAFLQNNYFGLIIFLGFYFATD